jgi:6,7-dimethyl-8-ribityllumazine synthase
MATVNKIYPFMIKNSVPKAKHFRFGVVVSEWNEAITELYNGAEQHFRKQGSR